jgi:tetratricopeptide (TPR) repeat protein
MSYCSKLLTFICFTFLILVIPSFSENDNFDFFYPGEIRDYYEIQFLVSNGLGKNFTRTFLNNFIETVNNRYFLNNVSKQTKKDLDDKKLDETASKHLLKALDYLGNLKFNDEILGSDNPVDCDLDKQIEEFSKAIELDPDYPYTYKYRGICYFKKGIYEKAIIDFSNAINLCTENCLFFEKRAFAYTKTKQYDNALSDYDKAIELNSTNAHIYYNRSCIYWMNKQFEKIIPDLKKVIDISTDNSKAMAREEMHSNQRHLNWAIRYDPDYMNPFRGFYARGNAYLKIGQTKMAIKDFEKATDWEPQYPNSYSCLGNIYKDMTKYSQSIYYYSKAIDVDPNKAIFYINRGLVYNQKEDKEKACADFKKACELGNCEMYDKSKSNGDCE